MLGWKYYICTFYAHCLPFPAYSSAGFYPVKCALGLSFYEQSTGTVLLPFFVLAAECFVVVIRGRLSGRDTAALFKTNLQTAAVLVLYLLDPSVVKAVLTVFLCHSPSVEGTHYLSADLTLTCYDGKHVVAMVCSTVVFVVFALGSPLFVVLKLRPFAGAADVEGDDPLRFLRSGYHPDRYPYWEAVIMLRKLALQCIAVLLSDLFVQGTSARSRGYCVLCTEML